MSTYEATDADLDAIAAEHAAQELALARDTLRLRTEALHRAIKRASEALTREAALRSAIEALAEEWEASRDTCLAWIADPKMHADVDHPTRLSRSADDLNRSAGQLRALLAAPSSPTGTPAAPEGTPGGSEAQEAHKGGNAEDCPTCSTTNPPYPFLCTAGA